MIEMTTMVIEKGTGISIQSHELLGATIVAIKMKNQGSHLINWQLLLVRAEVRGLGAHIDMIHILHTSLIMDQSAQTLHKVVLPACHMACTHCQP